MRELLIVMAAVAAWCLLLGVALPFANRGGTVKAWLRHLKDRLVNGRRLSYGETAWVVELENANQELGE